MLAEVLAGTSAGAHSRFKSIYPKLILINYLRNIIRAKNAQNLLPFLPRPFGGFYVDTVAADGYIQWHAAQFG